ncbi:MAG: glycoside hydrolase family 2 TIM barrel-domain containing protein, partial [Clostridiales bacterium]|nr:glycoside hydrolase family 2 TIM barrel-domain containing protein [Clostridiales bacterium]
MNIPRNEYPRPQLVREDWMNLNGEWQFEIDNSKCGEEKKFFERDALDGRIIVPFCPESELSGVNNKDFMECVWYRKEFEVPAEQKDKNILLHFGAVDYHAKVYVNGQAVGEHKGGYVSFGFDITQYIKEGKNVIALCAYDDVRGHKQPGGKQCSMLLSQGCSYTRTTGIWQTVWLEFVDKCYVDNVYITTDTDTPAAYVKLKLAGDFMGAQIKVRALWDGQESASASCKAYSNMPQLCLALGDRHLWEVGKGGLYDLEISIEKDGRTVDLVKSYFGLRSVCLDGRAFKINGKTVFGRWVLDQGFYPDGIYTAPNDEALKNDILYSMQLGFNGARLHEKIFEPRFLYWADKLGYIVWGEHANWGLDITDMGQIQYFLPEWLEALDRDMCHPSIIGWCPFNETWDFDGRQQYDELIRLVYLATKAVDPTRPVIDTSGNFHVQTDIFDVHDYEQNPERFASYYEKIVDGIIEDQIQRKPEWSYRQSYNGKNPVFVSEYG